MKETKCCYANDANVCTILMNEHCTGYKSICSFRKTEQEHIDAVNDAISINRAKGTVTSAGTGMFAASSGRRTKDDNKRVS